MSELLVPAILYKDEIEKEFAKRMYSDEMFYYMGWIGCNELPTLEPQDNHYRWAIVNKGKLIGYFAYYIDRTVDCVCQFGLYSFDRDNPLIGKAVFDKIKELVENHHRVEWRCIEGNHAFKPYKKFLKLIEKIISPAISCVYRLRDVTKDNKGEYRDEFIFEIINYDK